MTEDIKKKLYQWLCYADSNVPWDLLQDLKKAKTHIEDLEAELHLMKTAGIVEVSVRNPSVMEYMKHWEGRAEAAEAKLAKEVEQALAELEDIVRCRCHEVYTGRGLQDPDCQCDSADAVATLRAALQEKTDE